MNEQVLCCHSEDLHTAGIFQGLEFRVEMYKHLLWGVNAWYADRQEAETRPDWKQIIPFMVLVKDGNIFRYQRGKKGGEARLHTLWSVGVGGHINPGDKTYTDAALREFQEETGAYLKYMSAPCALINDDSTEVGKVHLGVVHVLDIANQTVCMTQAKDMEQGVIERGEFVAPHRLTDPEFMPQYESWSRITVENIWRIFGQHYLNEAGSHST